MTDYIELEDFKQRHGITTTDKDVRILEHITAASRKVDNFCHRSFSGDSVTSVRYFRPVGCELVWIDDAYEITSVELDQDDNGSFTETWATTDYETWPANGVLDGQSGWPATMLRAVGGSLFFPTCNLRRSVKVTAKWGWAAVPDAVTEACYLLTNRLFYEVSVPGGITPPNLDFGLAGSPLQRPYTAEGLLMPYVRHDAAIGVAG